jgi:P2 family phage contractile tail tube protein
MRDLLEYMGVFVDGRGYFGEAKSVVLPKMAVATRDFSASGMAGPIKVRMSRLAEQLMMELTFDAIPSPLYDLLAPSEGETFPFRLKGSTNAADGTKRAEMIFGEGFVEEFDEGTWEEAKEAPITLKVCLRHYERHIAGVERWAANPENMILRRNGTDLLEQHRINIGRQ